MSYHILRYWVPSGFVIPLDELGFLIDASSIIGQHQRESLRTIIEIPEQIAVLLGGSGDGKSTDLEFAEEHTYSSQVLRIDLLRHSSVELSNDNLTKRIEAANEYAIAVERDQSFTLLIDSFDECSCMDSKLVYSITSQLKSVLRPHDKVRIASRPDGLTELLYQTLVSEFGRDNVATYQIAPLSRSDVRDYAIKEGINQFAFISWIIDHDLCEFATSPILLLSLMTSFRKDSAVVVGRASLYNLHLQALIESSTQDASAKTRTLTTGEIMSIAEHIALATIFSNRHLVTQSSTVYEEARDAVSFDELIQGGHTRGAAMPRIERDSLIEVLSTPLFRILSDRDSEWLHRSYAEYLAASALSTISLNSSVFLSLFTSIVLTERSVPSQLKQCASFLLELRPDLLEEFLALDPDIFVVADTRHFADSDKARIIDQILRHYMLGNAYDRIHLRRRYRHLGHSDLADQLMPIIADPTMNAVVRRVAIDIAQECNTVAVLPHLLELALDNSNRLADRVQALHAINHLGNNNSKRLLRTLLSQSEESDPDSQLRGALLSALWPDFMSVAELVDVIIATKPPHLFGEYFSFVRYQLPNHISDDDLPAMLEMLITLLDVPDSYHSHIYLTVVVFSRCLSLVTTRADIRFTLCRLILTSADKGRSILRRSFADDANILCDMIAVAIANDDDLRRAVVSQISAIVSNPQVQVSHISHEYAIIFPTSDLDWYIEQLDSSLEHTQREFFCSLIQVAVDWNNSASANKVLTAAFRPEHHGLRDLLRHRIDPIDLDTVEAANMREWFRASHANSNKAGQSHMAQLIHAVRMFLDRIDQGDLAAWIQACRALSATPDTGYMTHEWEPDLTKAPLWSHLDDVDHGRLYDAALKYLTDYQLLRLVHPGRSHNWESLCAYKAIVLLYKARSEWLTTFDSKTWSTWIRSAMYYPTGYGMGDDDMHADIISIAYNSIPFDTRESFLALLRHDISHIRDKGNDILKDPSESLLVCQHKMTHCWDSDVEQLLMESILDNSDLPHVLPSILSFMLQHDSVAANRFVRDVLEAVVPDSEIGRMTWIACAVEAITYSKPEDWSDVWSSMLRQAELCKEAFLDYVYKERYSDRHLTSMLTERQTAEVFIWLERHFPHEADPEHTGAHMVSARAMIAVFRDGLLSALRNAGSASSIVELQGIHDLYPNLNWLSYTLADAKRIAHESSLISVDPKYLYSFIYGSGSMLVRSGYDLRDVIVESLERLSAKLQGHTPMAEYLWNECHNGKYTPKDETSLSNLIKHHLEAELLKPSRIVVNREVVIDAQGHKGKKTDIHVDCLPADSDTTRLKAIIEVKCCWNPGLLTDMKNQLVGQYLRESDCNVGLYVVGWYHCDSWDQSHRAKKTCKHESRDELFNTLTQQAEELSTGYRIVFPIVLDVSLRD